MAVKKGNTRIIFTTSKKQAEYLALCSKKTGRTISYLIRLFIKTSSAKYHSYLNEEEREAVIAIAKTPWLDDDD